MDEIEIKRVVRDALRWNGPATKTWKIGVIVGDGCVAIATEESLGMVEKMAIFQAINELERRTSTNLGLVRFL